MTNSTCTTRGITVEVNSFLVPERSDPARRQWLFAYRIQVTNRSEIAVSLISRHWVITDAEGAVEEVRGPGVVGQQPRLQPGASFEYTSFCPLRTSFGTMHGSYQMVPDKGEAFDVEIAPFALSEPHAIN